MGRTATTTFAARLGRLRETAGLSARRLGQLAGIAASHVSLIEMNGGVRVEARTVERIALVLGASIDWLYGGRGLAPSDADVLAAVAKAERAAKRTGTDG